MNGTILPSWRPGKPRVRFWTVHKYPFLFRKGVYGQVGIPYMQYKFGPSEMRVKLQKTFNQVVIDCLGSGFHSIKMKESATKVFVFVIWK